MDLDYGWGVVPVFSEDLFADPTIGPIMDRAGLSYSDQGNHIRAFHSARTAAALCRLDRAHRDRILEQGFGLIPFGEISGRDARDARARTARGVLNLFAVETDPDRMAAHLTGLYYTYWYDLRGLVVDKTVQDIVAQDRVHATALTTRGDIFDADALPDTPQDAPETVADTFVAPDAHSVPGGLSRTATGTSGPREDAGYVPDQGAAPAAHEDPGAQALHLLYKARDHAGLVSRGGARRRRFFGRVRWT